MKIYIALHGTTMCAYKYFFHVVLLQENGIYLLETMNTGPLVRDGVK